MRTKAFTLTEMLIVLVVVGVLATLGFPAYQKVIEDSRAQVCETNLRALKTALDIFAMENDIMPASLSALPQDYLERAYASLLKQKGVWRIKLARFITDFSRERNLAYAQQFFLNQLARRDMKLVTCPNDTNVNAFGSYGGNVAWVGQSSRVYQQLDDATLMLGDSELAVFNNVADLDARHRNPGLFGGQNYAVTVNRTATIGKQVLTAADQVASPQ